MHLIYTLLICGLQIHIFNSFKTPMQLQNILHIIYDKINKLHQNYIISYKNALKKMYANI